MYHHVLELEFLFEDHGARSGVITDSLVLERVVHEQRPLIQPLPTALQLDDRQEGVILPLDHAVTHAFPAHTSEFELQILDLTHVWPNRNLAQSTLATTLPWPLPSTCTSSCIFHRSKGSLPELLTAFAAPLVRRQPDDGPVRHNAFSSQQVVHTEFRMLQQLDCELATLTPMVLG